MAGNSDWLSYIQEKWSSSDPKDRAVGWIGKVIVEGGLFISVATAISLFVFVLFWVVGPSVSPRDAALTVWVTTVGLLTQTSFCNIITET